MKLRKKEVVNLKKGTYESAKISVKRGRLYTEDTFNSLSSMSFDEILKFMQENDYKHSIDTSYLNFDGFYLIERVLNVHTSRIYREVFSSASIATKELLETYYLKYQVHNFMAMIRCWQTKEDELEVYLIGDDRKKSKFLKAFEMPNIEDAIIYISKKLSFDFSVVLDSYKKGVFFLENYLYKNYYERLENLEFKYNGKDEIKFFNFIVRYVDLLNARTYMRIKIDENSNFKFKDLFILGGKYPLSFYENLNDDDIENCLIKFDKLYGNILVCSDNSCVASLDRRINEHKAKTLEYFKSINFGSPFYILKYLFDVEREVSRLRILLKSKHLDLSESELSEMIGGNKK